MPPRKYSKFTFSDGYNFDEEKVILTTPFPFRYKNFKDNRIYTTSEGDTLFHIAGIMFRGLPRPVGLWWIIMHFQPEPIHDPTIKFPAGTRLVIPSIRTVEEEIFNETRRDREE